MLLLFGLRSVAAVDEILLQASDDAPDLVELPLQFKELLLRDILLVLRYAEQDEEQGLFCVCLVQPLQPLLDDGEVVRHNGGPDELVARLLDLLIEGISIHAPREGGDRDKIVQLLTHEISIHAPREGGD